MILRGGIPTHPIGRGFTDERTGSARPFGTGYGAILKGSENPTDEACNPLNANVPNFY